MKNFIIVLYFLQMDDVLVRVSHPIEHLEAMNVKFGGNSTVLVIVGATLACFSCVGVPVG